MQTYICSCSKVIAKESVDSVHTYIIKDNRKVIFQKHKPFFIFQNQSVSLSFIGISTSAKNILSNNEKEAEIYLRARFYKFIKPLFCIHHLKGSLNLSKKDKDTDFSFFGNSLSFRNCLTAHNFLHSVMVLPITSLN